MPFVFVLSFVFVFVIVFVFVFDSETSSHVSCHRRVTLTQQGKPSSLKKIISSWTRLPLSLLFEREANCANTNSNCANTNSSCANTNTNCTNTNTTYSRSRRRVSEAELTRKEGRTEDDLKDEKSIAQVQIQIVQIKR